MCVHKYFGIITAPPPPLRSLFPCYHFPVVLSRGSHSLYRNTLNMHWCVGVMKTYQAHTSSRGVNKLAFPPLLLLLPSIMGPFAIYISHLRGVGWVGGIIYMECVCVCLNCQLTIIANKLPTKYYVAVSPVNVH